MNSTNLPTLSHKEAVREVYRHTPQIKDYDRFMHCGARWLPYTMYFHERNFVSASINADRLGFRYAHRGARRYFVAEMPDSGLVNLIVGGSTALGVGACSDKATLASRLSEETGEAWLNFAGRGYNATQELIMFLMSQDKFRQIGQVVVLSGLNTLALEGTPEEFSSDHGKYYYSYEFMHYMDRFNKDMRRKKDRFDASSVSFGERLQRLFFWRSEENPADKVMDDASVPLDARIDRAARSTAKALLQWKLLLAQFDARLTFFLQPLSYWCGKALTFEERSVFHAIDSCPNNFYRLFSNVLRNEVHRPYFAALSSAANDVQCFDMNALLRSSNTMTETIFVDRVHFNDAGNAEVARIVAGNL